MRIDAKTFEIALQFTRAQSFAISEPSLVAILSQVERALADLSALSLESSDAIAQRLGFTYPSYTALTTMSPSECSDMILKMNLAWARLLYARRYYAFNGEWPIFDGRNLPGYDLIGILG